MKKFIISLLVFMVGVLCVNTSFIFAESDQDTNQSVDAQIDDQDAENPPETSEPHQGENGNLDEQQKDEETHKNEEEPLNQKSDEAGPSEDEVKSKQDNQSSNESPKTTEDTEVKEEENEAQEADQSQTENPDEANEESTDTEDDEKENIAEDTTENEQESSTPESLGLHDESNEVKELKENLIKLGFGENLSDPSTYFDMETEKAVNEFQEYYALKVNGAGDEATLKKIADLLNHPYQRGNSSEKIKQLKIKLVALGYADWPAPTTFFGGETESTVEEFQRANDLAVNGILDDVTLKLLKNTNTSFTVASQSVTTTQMEYGNRSEEIQAFKLDLVSLGFGRHWENPTTYFGPDTQEVVKEFQSYYGLEATGTGNEVTLEKIEKLFSSPYQVGNSSETIQELKYDLMNLGCAPHWSTPTTYFGSDTESVVIDFQQTQGLAVNGILDDVTINAINELMEMPLSYGVTRPEVKDFKETLMDLGFGTHWNNPTDYFGPDTQKVVKEFQSYYGLEVTGAGDDSTLAEMKELLSSPNQKGNRSEAIQELKYDLMNLGFAPHWSTPTTYFGSDTEDVVRDFQQDQGLAVNGILDNVTADLINELMDAPLSFGLIRADVVDFKEKLMELGFGTHWNNPTDYFGPGTLEVVEEFQSYYGLEVTGTGDESTLAKMDEILSNPYQKGSRGEIIQELKYDLMYLGAAPHWSTPTTYFGSGTEEVVREFQQDQGLAVNGILDQVTVDLINELMDAPLSYGLIRADVVDFKETLMDLGFGTHWNNPTDYFGPGTLEVVEEFQSYYGLEVTGAGDVSTLAKMEEILSSPYQKGNSSEAIQELKYDLMHLGFAPHWSTPTTYFGSGTENVVEGFQAYFGLAVNGILDQTTLNKIEQEAASIMKKGQRSDQIQAVKNDLMSLGFADHWSNPTNYFGPETKTVVRNFQSFYDLSVTGVINPPTLNKIEELLSSHMRLGERSQQIKSMKEDLVSLGYASHWNNPTTYFGTGTESVVRKFQRINDLPVSGIADYITLRTINEEVEKNVVNIFLDPGHGDHDPGGQGYNLDEKDVVLDIALKTADVLTNRYSGVNVLLSRTDDTFVDLLDRSRLANGWGADYFVSFHTNAFNGSAGGFETYIYNGGVSKETKERQDDIHNYLANRIDVNDRGQKRANFSVVRETTMPAILLEYMFIDNKRENEMLRDPNYRDYLGVITAEAIANTFALRQL